jgi:uncharacterized protein YndB with AHSA1/START domain
VTFEELKGKTKFALSYDLSPPPDMIKPMSEGWNQSFDKLDAVIKEEKSRLAKTTLVIKSGKQEVSMSRIYNAPGERVFKALTVPKLLSCWWAPYRFSIKIDKVSAKVGGTWRILNKDAEGNEHWFHGIYHEISPQRIVQTWEYEGMPGHVLLGIATLKPVGPKTKLTMKSVFESIEDRDGMLKAGMAEGGMETMDRLAKLVENSKKK